MKKTLAILLSLALMLSCLLGLTISTAAEEVPYVEEFYDLRPVMEEEFGTHEVDEEGNLKEEPLFGNGLWTLEYYTPSDNAFHPVSCYFAEAQASGLCQWGAIYYANQDGMWGDISETTYIAFQDAAKRFHPAPTGGGAVYTFIVPYTGTISFHASVQAYGSANTSDNEEKGNVLSLYINDKKQWPENVEDGLFYYDTTQAEGKAADLESVKVNKGDKIRMMVTVKPDTGNGGKGCYLVDYPVVTYHEAFDENGKSIPVGNPKGTPPSEILTEESTAHTISIKWDATKNAVGYNVYVNGEKVNAEPLTNTSYTIEKLDGGTTYTVQVSSVTATAESELSVEAMFRTKKGPAYGEADNTDTSAPATGETSDAPATENKTDATEKGAEEKDNGMLWIIIGVAAAVVLVAAAVVVVLVLKKKKA